MFSGSWISPYIRKGRQIVQTELENPRKTRLHYFLSFTLRLLGKTYLKNQEVIKKRLDKLLKICYTIRVVRKVRFLKNKKELDKRERFLLYYLYSDEAVEK